MSTRQEGIKSKDSTRDSEHGPDDEQADARRHDAAGRQGRAGDAAAAPPGGREVAIQRKIPCLSTLACGSIQVLFVRRIFSVELAP